MSPIQQMLLGVGAVDTKTYVDDVFSTFLYEGTGSAQSINNGIDLSGEGGMTWIKRRSGASDHAITDTVRGAGNSLKANENNSNYSSTNFISAFNSNGFSIGTDADVGSDDDTFASWTFRKAPGFFDVVTYTGNGSNRTIAHSLGSIPGCIMIKCTSAARSWQVYHRGIGNTHALKLDATNAEDSSTAYWNDSDHTSTHFSLGYAWDSNKNDETYVAYVFAGGESTNALARSVKFIRSSSQTLAIPNNDDFNLGTGDYTVECWVKLNSSNGQNIWAFGSDTASTGMSLYSDGSQNTYLNFDNSAKILSGDGGLSIGQWHHVAVVRNSGTAQFFIDGNSQGTSTQSSSPQGYVTIGASGSSSSYLDGNISNFRIVKGTAVYTSSFRPPTEPLTNITNTKLLCCNDSSTTGSTVTPDTISANGSPTASSDSPFDDPAGFAFGDAGDQNVIKCGSYVGDGSNPGVDVNIGWEPSFVMIKRTDTTGNWVIYDSLRGIVTRGDDPALYPNLNNAEQTTGKRLSATPTGFQLHDGNFINQNNATYIYLAIRRSDGYVGKPPSLGSGCFAMDTGSGGSAIPVFDSGFPVDFALKRTFGSSDDWGAGSRLTNDKFMYTNSSNAETTNYHWGWAWDSNAGVFTSGASTQQSWMWKRHAGFDVVTYEGNGVAGRYITHTGLGKTPEMIWLKNRSGSQDWIVYHKGLNGGSNPGEYELHLNNTNAEDRASNFYDTDPTATTFRVDSGMPTNYDGHNYIAMLFASVDGISSVGSYSGSSSTVTVTTGFQPRFVIIKNRADSGDWFVLDTTRGWGSGNDNYLMLQDTDAQSSLDVGAPTSTGFTVNSVLGFNTNGNSYLYYAHA